MAKRETSFPPVKVAVLIDGGFFIKRFNALYNKDKQKTGEEVAEMLYTMAMKHVGSRNSRYKLTGKEAAIRSMLEAGASKAAVCRRFHCTYITLERHLKRCCGGGKIEIKKVAL